MKRLLLLVLAAAVAAIAICYAFRSSRRSSSAAVFALLPRETVALAVIPDFNATRSEWRRTDVHALWQEPAVQEFLRKPRMRFASGMSVPEKFDDLERLHATDVFMAVTEAPSNGWKISGGFRYKKSAPDAEKILASWRTRLLSASAAGRQETSEYEQHRIETVTAGSVSVSTASAGEWFLGASDMEELKRLLDRVDGRAKKPAANLAADEIFAAANKQMPKNYATLVYGRPDRLAALFSSNAASAVGESRGLLTALADVRSFCVATWFDSGKVRDRTFVAMPKKIAGDLTRSSLALGAKETFFVFNTLADLGGTMLNHDPAAGVTHALQPMASALDQSGITAADWNSAFDSELTIMGEWPAESRWPSIVAAVPVKDAGRADQIATNLSRAAQSGDLAQRTSDGVRYFSAPASGQLFSISPTIGISDRWLLGGVDPAMVETMFQRASAGAPGLSVVPAFQTAQSMVPSPHASYVFVDAALLYTRIDAALRPMLLMGAAFVPGINDTVDLGRFPAPEVITRHLSPITMSQSYVDGGYLAESAGPVTLNGMFAGIAALGGAGTSLYQQQIHGSTGGGGWPIRPNWPRTKTAPPSGTPTSTP